MESKYGLEEKKYKYFPKVKLDNNRFGRKRHVSQPLKKLILKPKIPQKGPVGFKKLELPKLRRQDILKEKYNKLEQIKKNLLKIKKRLEELQNKKDKKESKQ